MGNIEGIRGVMGPGGSGDATLTQDAAPAPSGGVTGQARDTVPQANVDAPSIPSIDLFDFNDSTWKPVPWDQATGLIRSGMMAPKAGSQLILERPEGGFQPVDAARTRELFDQGWSIADPGAVLRDERKAAFSGPMNTALATGLGALRGATLGLSDAFLTLPGVSELLLGKEDSRTEWAKKYGDLAPTMPEILAGLREFHGVAGTLGEIGSFMIPISPAAKVVSKVGGRAAEAAEDVLLSMGKDYPFRTAVSKALAQGGAEGALIGAGSALTENQLSTDPSTGWELAAGMAKGATIGALLGAPISAALSMPGASIEGIAKWAERPDIASKSQLASYINAVREPFKGTFGTNLRNFIANPDEHGQIVTKALDSFQKYIDDIDIRYASIKDVLAGSAKKLTRDDLAPIEKSIDDGLSRFLAGNQTFMTSIRGAGTGLERLKNDTMTLHHYSTAFFGDDVVNIIKPATSRVNKKLIEMRGLIENSLQGVDSLGTIPRVTKQIGSEIRDELDGTIKSLMTQGGTSRGHLSTVIRPVPAEVLTWRNNVENMLDSLDSMVASPLSSYESRVRQLHDAIKTHGPISIGSLISSKGKSIDAIRVLEEATRATDVSLHATKIFDLLGSQRGPDLKKALDNLNAVKDVVQILKMVPPKAGIASASNKSKMSLATSVGLGAAGTTFLGLGARSLSDLATAGVAGFLAKGAVDLAQNPLLIAKGLHRMEDIFFSFDKATQDAIGSAISRVGSAAKAGTTGTKLAGIDALVRMFDLDSPDGQMQLKARAQAILNDPSNMLDAMPNIQSSVGVQSLDAFPNVKQAGVKHSLSVAKAIVDAIPDPVAVVGPATSPRQFYTQSDLKKAKDRISAIADPVAILHNGIIGGTIKVTQAQVDAVAKAWPMMAQHVMMKLLEHQTENGQFPREMRPRVEMLRRALSPSMPTQAPLPPPTPATAPASGNISIEAGQLLPASQAIDGRKEGL